MIGRRDALKTVGLVALGGCARPSSAAAPSSGSAPDLDAELAALSGRTLSEEGIPEILVGEDLVRPRTGPAEPRTEGAKLAAELLELTEAFRRKRPTAPASELATIVQILAARDFRRGGGG